MIALQEELELVSAHYTKARQQYGKAELDLITIEAKVVGVLLGWLGFSEGEPTIIMNKSSREYGGLNWILNAGVEVPPALKLNALSSPLLLRVFIHRGGISISVHVRDVCRWTMICGLDGSGLSEHTKSVLVPLFRSILSQGELNV